MSVHEKVALVTGGASGIGRASALLLAQNGADLVVADRDLAGAEATARQIGAQGGRALAFPLDVARPDSVRQAVERTLSAFRKIDILVHCAGVCPRRTVLEMSNEEWREVIGINLDGSFYLARDVGRVMAERGAGTMILLTSDRGVYGSADYAHYAASKGGLIALTKSFAIALGPRGVTVNAINPGFTDTPMARASFTDADWDKRHAFDPLGRHSEPEEIAQTVLFLAGTGGGYMTGQIVTTRMRF